MNNLSEPDADARLDAGAECPVCHETEGCSVDRCIVCGGPLWEHSPSTRHHAVCRLSDQAVCSKECAREAME